MSEMIRSLKLRTNLRTWFGNKSVRVACAAFIAALSVIMIVSDAQAAWYNSNWQYRKMLTIDYSDPAMRRKVPLPTAPTAPGGQVSGQSVTLSWGASADANGGAVAGYNLHRSTSPNGPYTQINTPLIMNIQYADSTLQTGTYYCVLKSVDSDGYESPGTLEMTVTIGARNARGPGGGSGGGCFISTMSK